MPTQYCMTLALAASFALAGCAGQSSLQVIDNVLRHEPPALARLAEPVAPAAGPRLQLLQVLEPYLRDLAAAHRALQAAAPPLGLLPLMLPSPATQRDIATKVDAAALRRATDLFLGANADFARALRILRELGVAPQSPDRVPNFLLQAPSTAPFPASNVRSTER